MDNVEKKWNDMSNSNIRIKLETLRHSHEVIKSKIDSLIDEFSICYIIITNPIMTY